MAKTLSNKKTRASNTRTRDLHGAIVRELERLGVPLLMLVMILYFSFEPSVGPAFTSSANIRNILGNQAVTSIIALSMVVPLVAGYFDLSASATMGVSNVAVASALGPHGWPLWAGLLLGLGLGGLIGFINGFLVARLKLNGFVVTLGVYTLLLGLLQLYTQGQQILNGIPTGFISWSANTWLGIPTPFYVLVIVAGLTWYILEQIPFGRYLEAIGSNESAARLVGINTERVIWTSFVTSGLLAATAGALQTSRAGNADPTVATSFLFPALVAVFLSATMIKPGRYNVWGTIIGVFFVAISVSGFTLSGADIWIQQVFNGAALVLAVLLSTLIARSRESRAAGAVEPAPPRSDKAVVAPEAGGVSKDAVV